MTRRRVLMAFVAIILVASSVVVFVGFDRTSHSASDTIRPFLITMGPVWLLAALAAYHLTTKRHKS